MEEHKKMGLSPNHLLLSHISIEMTIFRRHVSNDNVTGHVAVSDWIESTAGQT